MSHENQAPVAEDFTPKTAGGAAETSRTLSDFTFDAMKEQSVGRAAGTAAAEAVTSATQSMKDGHQAPAEAGKSLGDHGQKAVEKGLKDLLNGMDKNIGNDGLKHINKLPREVTQEDRDKAKKVLEKELNELIPEADRKAVTDLQNAIIDGDAKKLGEVIKGMDPAKLDKYIKAVNDNLNKHETFGGVELTRDSQGNVLLYGEKGNTAVSIDPKTGAATLRAVERQPDGSVLLKPGEIINRNADDVARELGDSATRSITGPWGWGGGIIKPTFPIERFPEPIKPIKPLPRDFGPKEEPPNVFRPTQQQQQIRRNTN